MLRAPVAACLLALFAATAARATVASKNDTPLGWASQNGGTTGGAGGTEVTVTTMADLQKYAKMAGKYIIWVSGTMGSYGTRGSANEDQVVLASNKTILGLPGATVKGGFNITGVSNVILRNITVIGPGAIDVNGNDDIHLQADAKNIWVDHMSVIDGEDGNMDITHACDFVTVSWTKFSYTSNSIASGHPGVGGSHRFCNLIGHDDGNAAEDNGHLKVTFYKTWWADGVAERMPRVRFGQVHVANNLFTSQDPGQDHCVRAGIGADILVESNAFISQKKPIDLYQGNYKAVTARNNLFSNCSGNMVGSGTSFTPPYSLPLAATSGLQAEISSASSGAGPTLTWGTTSIAPEPGHEVSYAPRVERQGSREILTNPDQNPVTATVWSATGRRLSSEMVLQPGESVDLPVVAGMRILKLVTAQGEESRVLSLK
jgi:pectate lyase